MTLNNKIFKNAKINVDTDSLDNTKFTKTQLLNMVLEMQKEKLQKGIKKQKSNLIKARKKISSMIPDIRMVIQNIAISKTKSRFKSEINANKSVFANTNNCKMETTVFIDNYSLNYCSYKFIVQENIAGNIYVMERNWEYEGKDDTWTTLKKRCNKIGINFTNFKKLVDCRLNKCNITDDKSEDQFARYYLEARYVSGRKRIIK